MQPRNPLKFERRGRFHTDLLEHWGLVDEIGKRNPLAPELNKKAVHSMVEALTNAKVLRVDAAKAAEFYSKVAPEPVGDLTKTPFPYKNLFIEFDEPVGVQGDGERIEWIAGIGIHGVQVKEGAEHIPEPYRTQLREHLGLNLAVEMEDIFFAAVGMFTVESDWYGFIMDPSGVARGCTGMEECKYIEGTFSRSLRSHLPWVSKDENVCKYIRPDLRGPVSGKSCPVMADLWRMASLVYYLLNYAFSPKVELVEKNYESMGGGKGEYSKPIPHQYYELKLREGVTLGGGKPHRGGEHRYQYPVRGHWRHIKGGRMVWVSAHFRGLKHTVVVEKIYVKEDKDGKVAV